MILLIVSDFEHRSLVSFQKYTYALPMQLFYKYF